MLAVMLAKQEHLNRSIHPDWRAQEFNWPRAIWAECAELMDRFSWKWWKSPPDEDRDQAKLELVDIFHFGLSLVLQAHTRKEAVEIFEAGFSGEAKPLPIPEACDRMVATASASRWFAIPAFRSACATLGMDLRELFQLYMGKHLLNEFRQAHGYRSGHYLKHWYDGREDNVHLQEVLDELLLVTDLRYSADFEQEVLLGLTSRYTRGAA
jgi:hypothetical protein